MLLFIVIVVTVYVVSFKSDFTQEHLDKLTPALILLAAFFILLLLVSFVRG